MDFFFKNIEQETQSKKPHVIIRRRGAEYHHMPKRPQGAADGASLRLRPLVRRPTWSNRATLSGEFVCEQAHPLDPEWTCTAIQYPKLCGCASLMGLGPTGTPHGHAQDHAVMI